MKSKHRPQRGLTTQFTRTGERDTTNRKPFRTAEQKAEARRTARLVDGRHVSSAPYQIHSSAKRGRAS